MIERFTPIPVIDVFAGPGGLGEGFSACFGDDSKRRFKLVLSIEKDKSAHSSLELRAFYRQFKTENVPLEYYAYLRGEITRDELFNRFPEQSQAASLISWHAELGCDRFPPEIVDQRIKNALCGAKNWVLIGGPPCQAYSLGVECHDIVDGKMCHHIVDKVL
jgi:DNA (cytosine-5)-methyltransferase 1